MAGIAAAATNNSEGIAGAGWNSSVMALKVVNTAGDITITENVAPDGTGDVLLNASGGAIKDGGNSAVIAMGTPPHAALWLSLLLGGATVLWPYGKSFYTEAWQAATMIWAAAFCAPHPGRPVR